VSTPIAWDELGPQIRANHFTVENLPNRLAYLDRDPWEGFFELSQTLPGGGAKRPAKKGPRTAAKRK
jgi:bifunctional non-homologous end joining protein LigD